MRKASTVRAVKEAADATPVEAAIEALAAVLDPGGRQRGGRWGPEEKEEEQGGVVSVCQELHSLAPRAPHTPRVGPTTALAPHLRRNQRRRRRRRGGGWPKVEEMTTEERGGGGPNPNPS